MTSPPTIVVGAGPAGLMAATVLAEAGQKVMVYDAMPGAGRKFMVAGRGGLNLTNSEPLPAFAERYGEQAAFFARLLQEFSPTDLRQRLNDLGVATFIGTSGRVFPKEATAGEILRAWQAKLIDLGVGFSFNHRWLDISAARQLRFRSQATEITVQAAAVVLALGGGSWPQTGSDGAWTTILTAHQIKINQLVPANCGFEVAWSPFFRDNFAGQPLKNIRLTTNHGEQATGELVITRHGIEGGGIYPLCRPLRTELMHTGSATVHLDLKRDLPPAEVAARLAKPHGKESLANLLRKRLRLAGPYLSLLRECCPPAAFTAPQHLAACIKALPLRLTGIRPLSEAISSAGGVAFAEVDEHLMLTKLPGVFVAGEMLDWEAPTGGYLLQGAFCTGYHAAHGVLQRLQASPDNS